MAFSKFNIMQGSHFKKNSFSKSTECQMSGFLLYFHCISNIIGNKQKETSPFIEEDKQQGTVQEEGLGCGITPVEVDKITSPGA